MTNNRWIADLRPARTMGLVGLVGLAAACGGSGKLTDAGVDAPPGPPRAVVVAGDFEPGNPGALTTLDLTNRTLDMKVGPVMAVGSDPILRHFGSDLLIVNRNDGNNVTILDDQTLTLRQQIGTGPGTNPQDVAVFDDKLYVATFNGTGLVVLTRGSTEITTIDLSADDPDGRPNCNSVYRVDSHIYVSCGLLDDAGQLAPRGPGKVYVLDAATGALKPGLTMTLATRNPIGLFEQVIPGAPHAGDLVIPTVLFNFGEPDDGVGCIERITPGATPVAHGCYVDNADIEGFASRITFQVFSAVSFMWVTTPRAFPRSQLRGYDMGSNTFWEGSVNPDSQLIGDVALCPTGETVVTDTADPGGLRIYNVTEVTTAMMPIGFIPRSPHGLACY
jgi:hypothetical protein